MTQETLIAETQTRAVYALATSPSYAADGVCFAATVAGLLRSADHAASFDDGFASLGLSEPLATPGVAISPAFASDKTVFAGVNGAVLRSLDSGATWQYAPLRSPPPVVTCLAVSPAYEEDGIAFAGTLQDGVFRSADRGSRWASWNFGLIDLSALCLAISPDFGRDETLLVGTETGLFRSANGGRAWREIELTADLAPILSLAFSPDYAQDGRLFIGTEENGLWQSADRGKNWTSVAGLEDTAVNALLVEQGQGRLRLAALAEEDLLVSSDGGLTWRVVPLEFPDEAAPMCIAAPLGLDSGAVLVGCSDGAVRHVAL